MVKMTPGHKLKAFTILETMLGMMLSAILIGFAYFAYLAINHSYSAFIAKNDEMVTLLRLDELLKKDFLKARTITRNQSGIELQIDIDHVDYIFTPVYIVRKSIITDTFKVTTVSTTMLAGNEMIDKTTSSASENRIDQLNLSLVYKNDTINYQYQKLYSAENLFK